MKTAFWGCRGQGKTSLHCQIIRRKGMQMLMYTEEDHRVITPPQPQRDTDSYIPFLGEREMGRCGWFRGVGAVNDFSERSVGLKNIQWFGTKSVPDNGLWQSLSRCIDGLRSVFLQYEFRQWKLREGTRANCFLLWWVQEGKGMQRTTSCCALGEMGAGRRSERTWGFFSSPCQSTYQSTISGDISFWVPTLGKTKSSKN